MSQNRLLTSCLTAALLCFTATAATAQKAPLCPINADGRVANVNYKDSVIFFEPIVQHERIQLTVTTPCSVFTKVFDQGDTPVFDLNDVEGAIDGRYTWEVRVVPYVDPDTREELNRARANGDLKTPLQLQQQGRLPSGPLVESASFSVIGGSIVFPDEEEPQGKRGGAVATKGGGSAGFSADGSYSAAGSRGEGTIATKDFVINDDLIVDGSACIGFDCVNGEVFSFDTIRLKENNLRIKFDDTSVAASFPRNDWQLVANESANGGASKFSIEDVTNGKTPFTVEANARSHSLYVDDGGRIGSRTSTPSVEIHTIDGDTPTLRLQQDGSSGFEPQTWDVAGNETNFFIRDVTNGSALPFRIRPGAPSNAIFVDVDGDVGLGTSSPGQALHIARADAPKIEFDDTSTGVEDWEIGLNVNNDFIIDYLGTAGQVHLRIDDTTGDLHVLGTVNSSSRELKEGFHQVDVREILERVSQLELTEWTYRHDASRSRHLGPIAEDFHALFGYGSTDKGIGVVDADGVALAAIQALHQELQKKEAELEALEASFTERLAAIEARLEAAAANTEN